MNLEDYFSTYGNRDKDFLCGDGSKKESFILDGMLLFDEESAPSWGGPFPGNFAYFMVSDERCRKNLISEVEQVDNFIKSYNKNSKRKFDKSNMSDEEYNALLAYAVNEYPTLEKPFRLYMTGNDDTSYSKNFSQKSEAIEFVRLLEVCQPINLHKDIQPHFAFTN